MIYEYLSKERKSVSAYGCLFDLETRKIKLLLHQEYEDGNNYRSLRDFWHPSVGVMRSFCSTINPNPKSTGKKKKR